MSAVTGEEIGLTTERYVHVVNAAGQTTYQERIDGKSENDVQKIVRFLRNQFDAINDTSSRIEFESLKVPALRDDSMGAGAGW